MSLKQDYDPPPEGYVPVVTRTPQALEDERVERERVALEERIAATVEELGVSKAEARKIVTGR